MNLLALVLIAAFTVSGVNAQPVYRCANTYSHTPCPQARLVDVDDPRSEDQRAEAQRVAETERRLGTELRQDRLAAQRAVRPMVAISLSGAPAIDPAPRVEARRKIRHRLVRTPATTDFVTLDPRSRRQRPGP
jgi:hypothetical protein